MMKSASRADSRQGQGSIHTELLSKSGQRQRADFRHDPRWHQKPVLVLSAGSGADEKAGLVTSVSLLASEFYPFRAAAHRQGWQIAEHQAAEQRKLIFRKLKILLLLPPRGMIDDGGNLDVQRRYCFIEQ